MIKSIRIRQTEYVAHVGQNIKVCKMYIENLNIRDHVRDIGLYGKNTILKWVLKGLEFVSAKTKELLADFVVNIMKLSFLWNM